MSVRCSFFFQTPYIWWGFGLYFVVTLIGFSYVLFNWPAVPQRSHVLVTRNIERKPRHLAGKQVKVPCQPTSHATLRKFMGPAFNPRYMSVTKPTEYVKGSETVRSMQGDQRRRKQKKKTPAFHVSDDFVRILYKEPVLFSSVKQQILVHDGDDAYREAPKRTMRLKFRTTTTTEDPGKVLDDEFEQVEPVMWSEEAENVSSKIVPPKPRPKRNVQEGFPWACESRVEWMDLGDNHFPRFLRSVVCLTKRKCWFGHFHCQPRAFTVKILRRRKDSCVWTGADPLFGSVVDLDDASALLPPEFREQWVFEERAVTFCCECGA